MKIVPIAAAALAALSCPHVAFAQTAAPANSVNVESLSAIAGAWSYRTYPGGSEAAFSDSAGTRRLVMRCDRVTRVVSFVRTGVPSAAP